MKNNLVSFREQYPELAYHIDNHFDDWEDQFNDLPLLDIATSKADAAARKAHYQEQGYRLMDEDYIGLGINKVAIIQCYLNDLNEPQPEYKRIKVVRILLRKRKDDKIRLAICLNEDNLWELPSYYITKGMHVPTDNICEVEDLDNEYIYYHMERSNIHGTRNCLWRTVESLIDCPNLSKAQLTTLIRVLRVLLDWIQFDSSVSRVDYYFNLYKQLHQEWAKRKYIEELDFYLSGRQPIIFDGIFHPANLELLRKERQTLAHFQPIEQLPLSKEEVIKHFMTLRFDGRSDKLSSYSCFARVDITQFGGRIESVSDGFKNHDLSINYARCLSDIELQDGVTYLFSKDTGLPVDIIIDGSESYKLFNHALCLYVVGNNDNVIPVTISEQPSIMGSLNKAIEAPIVKFIKENLDTLRKYADLKIDGTILYNQLEQYRQKAKNK